jgi:hypothetical protein
MTSSKSVGFIFFALALLPFVASSQTFPKISGDDSADGGSAAEHPICKHHRGGDVDHEKPEPLMGTGPNEKIKQGRPEGRTGLET